MKLVFSETGWKDHLHWRANDATTLKRLNEVIRDAMRSPFSGIGKPEPLRDDLRGWWSRRITGEHRLVYRVSGDGPGQQLEILTCRFHYRG